MSQHNYTNPAFCQQSEFYNGNHEAVDVMSTTPSKIQRSESTRSFHNSVAGKTPLSATRNVFQRVNSERHAKQLFVQQRELPPKPGPKPAISTSRIVEGGRYGSVNSVNQASSGRYALVPVEELNSNNKGRYAVLPESEIEMISAVRIARSQDNLDRIVSSPVDENPHNLSADQFTSLPPTINSKTVSTGRLVPAFSTDFGSKSFVLYDQRNMQRYEVVPTEENEELVDPNHEIIQMENGRVHRYAVIPTEEEETALGPPYATINDQNKSPPRHAPPVKARSPIRNYQMYSDYPPGNVTPRKNPIATQKLHELLTTPQKQVMRQSSVTPKSTPIRIRPPPQPKLSSSTPKHEFTPQKLEYEQIKTSVDSRTTAIISPRLQSQSIYSETTTSNSMMSKSWNSVQILKTANGSAAVGAISLMLVLCGILNSGLSLYITSQSGRSYFLDVGLISGFACLGLGTLGFKSRQCNWLPNRNYISGYVLVTVFSILNCCGLVALLMINPFPRFATHDVISGIILGLSSITLVFISLGVISSRWCRVPPPDARIEPV